MLKRREKKKGKDFEKIYDTHVEQIFRFVYLKVGSKDDAEDITSRVFTQTWKSVADTDIKAIKKPRALLYRIARNLVIDYYRKNRPVREEESKEGSVPTKKSSRPKQVPLEDVIVVDKEMRPDEKALLNSQVEEVKSALQELNEDYQNVIIWYYLDELTTSEIAELLEKPEASIRVLIHRAVESLKKRLGNKGKR